MEAKGATGKGTKDEPQMLCNNKDMPIQEKIDDVIEGWEGKAKGMFQTLWERGFVDPDKPNTTDHTLNGKKDACGTLFWKLV
jgi:hypothetical protein